MSASITRIFDEDAVHNETNGQLVRVAEVSTPIEVFDSNSAIKWFIKSETRFYEDSGEEKVRLTNTLQANIFETDTVQFFLAFQPRNQANPTDPSAIGEDYFSCQMTANSADTRYWQASITDGKVTCTAATDASDRCLTAHSGLQSDNNPEASSDWTVPVTDEDGGALSPWCTPVNTVDAALSDFWCSELKCVIERVLDTGDTENDYAITPSDAGSDYLDVRAGQARIYINPGTYGTGVVNTDFFSIEVVKGAISVTASVAAVLAGASMLAF